MHSSSPTPSSAEIPSRRKAQALFSAASRDAERAFWRALDQRFPGASAILRQVGAKTFAADPAGFELVATPQYRGSASDGPFIRWAIVVRSDSPAQALGDLRGRGLALRRADHDGVALLRADVAYLAAGQGFFRTVEAFPTCDAQLEAVAAGAVEAALLDGAAWTARIPQRSNLIRYRLLHWTSRAPAPPFVVRAGAEPGAAEGLADALEALAADADTRRTILAPLGIERFHRLPKAQYRALEHYDQIAASQGYERLR